MPKQSMSNRIIGSDPRTIAGFNAPHQNGKTSSKMPNTSSGKAGNQMQVQGTKSGKGGPSSKGIKKAAYGVSLGDDAKGIQKSAKYKTPAGQGVNVAGKGSGFRGR